MSRARRVAARRSRAEAEAAKIMADLFSSTVLPALDKPMPRTFLYVWERKALAWLRAWRKRDKFTGICAWTSMYMRHGPPPWRDKT